MKWMLSSGQTALAVAIGLGPGLLLPFVVALQLSPAGSDRTVLAFSVATSLLGIVVPATEARSIAVVGYLMRKLGSVDRVTHRRLVLSTLKWSIPVTVVGAGGLAALYGSRDSDATALLAMVAVVAVAPILGSVSAVNAGSLLASGRTRLVISTQGLRSALPLLALWIWPSIALIVLASLFVVGELLRIGVLHAARARIPTRAPEAGSVPQEGDWKDRAGGLPWQMSANALGELNPAVARTHLVSDANGSVTAFELSEKVVAMATQIAYNFGLLPRVGGWSTATRDAGYRLFRRDALIIFLTSLCLCVVGVVGILVLSVAGLVPTAWRFGLDLAMVALLGSPAVAVAAGAVRYLAILGAQRLLVIAMAISVLSNAILSGLLVAWLGPIGVVASLVVTRYVLAGGLLVTIVRRSSRREE